MLVDDDMAVFFSPDFAAPWVRLAGVGVDAAQFPAILGVQDVEALQGYALGAEYELCYATGDVDLAEGQTLQETSKPQIWRVRQEPRRTNDGLTSSVFIGLVS